MKFVSIVGARPQFVKAAPVCRALRERHEEILVHSGQHYDHEMSDVFFEELGIPQPDFNLGVGSGGHGRQTGEMLGLLEELVIEQAPDAVIVYGDTNTTLAGALAASKLGVPVAHVEAGLRSFDRSMPEEINRVVVDHISDVLLCPTQTAIDNLAGEGISRGVSLVGDVMLDTARLFARDQAIDPVLVRQGLVRGAYYLATVHRAATSDSTERLSAILRAFGRLDKPVLWALHPRTRKSIESRGLEPLLLAAGNICAADPLPYRDTLALLRGAAALLTDSGGMQKEAYFFGVPCVTLRDTTEWVETVELGWNRLAGTEEEAIVEAVRTLTVPESRPPVYGNGHASDAVVSALEQYFKA